MGKSSRRELFRIPDMWPATQIQDALTRALDGTGAALAFGPSQFQEVEPDIAVVIPTSGSTGDPKEVALSSEALIASANASHKFLGATPGQRWSLALPTNHIAGVNALVRSIALGTDLVDENFEYTSIVPTQLFRALDSDGELKEKLQNARAVLVGGGASAPELLQRADEAGINVVTTYGMSEMSGGCVYNNIPLEGVDVQIREDGRIALRGPMQASGYLGSNKSAFESDGWFLTNDAGYLEDGKLFVTGRIDDQIISGGEKISLGTIDEFLNQNGFKFMSCSISDPEWGEQLCIASNGPIDKNEIKNLLRKQFGSHCAPKKYLENIELPVTSIGKPDRKTLSKRFEMMNQ